jgi:hypothetical protein
VYPYIRKRKESKDLIASTKYSYYSKGDERTHGKKGGVVLYSPFDKELARTVFKDVKSSLNLKLDYLAIEFIAYVANIGKFVWTTVRLGFFNSGKVDAKIENIAFRITQYSGSMKYRAILEVLFVLFILFYTYREMYNSYQLWEAQRAIDNLGCAKPGAQDSNWKRFIIFFYIDPKQADKESPVIN